MQSIETGSAGSGAAYARRDRTWARWVLPWCLLLLAGAVRGQASAPLAAPNLDLRTHGIVHALAVQPDGGVIVGGEFASIDGVPRRNIARLRPDGTLDPDWNPQAFGSVLVLAVDINGDVYAGGDFFNIGGQPRSSLARLSGSGTGAADPAWAPAPAGGTVNALVSAGDVVYVGGNFTSVNGEARNRLAAIKADDGALLGWNPGANGTVFALAADDPSWIYVGGAFSELGGITRPRLGVVSSTTGQTGPAWSPAPNGSVVTALTIHADFIYVVGDFTNIGGQVRNTFAKVYRYNDGMAAPLWAANACGPVRSVAIGPAGEVYAGGDFACIGGEVRSHIARLSGTGGDADSDWNPGANRTVRALATTPGGIVVAGGEFFVASGLPRTGLARFDVDGEPLPALDALQPSRIQAIAYQSDGAMIVGGRFDSANAHARSNLLRLWPDGSLDTDWDPSATSVGGVAASVTAIAVGPDDDVFVGGSFNRVDGLVRSHLAKLSGGGTGAPDPDWNPGMSCCNGPNALMVDANGALYVGGSFSSVGGVTRSNLAKLSGTDTGVVDAGWNPAPNGEVKAMALGPAGTLYASGLFTQIGGQPRERIAKVSADSGEAIDGWEPTANASVDALAVAADGSVFAGGTFTSIGGQARSRIAKLAAGTGQADPVWNPSASSTVRAIALGADGAVYVGGNLFSQLGGAYRAFIAKLSGSGTGTVDPAWNPGSNGVVHALAVAGNVLRVGGEFTQLGGQVRIGLAGLPTAASASQEARLSALVPSIGSLDPVFSPARYDYGLVLAAGVGSIAFTPIAMDAGAMIRVNGTLVSSGSASPAVVLQPGSNPVVVQVTAADGVSQHNYRVDALRLSPDPVLLAVSIRLQPVPARMGAGQLRSYEVTVRNVGSARAEGVYISAPSPAGLLAVLWQCEAAGGCAPAAGEGAIASGFDLDSGAAARIEITGEPDPVAAFVDVRVQASAASGAAISQARGSLSDPVNGIGVMRHGFED